MAHACAMFRVALCNMQVVKVRCYAACVPRLYSNGRVAKHRAHGGLSLLSTVIWYHGQPIVAIPFLVMASGIAIMQDYSIA